MAKERVRAYVMVSSKRGGVERSLKKVKHVTEIKKIGDDDFLATIEAESHSHALEIITAIEAIGDALTAIPVMFAKG